MKYEYRTTEGPRKAWDGEPDLSKEGWEEYKEWERFDYTEERYWRRPIPKPQAEERQWIKLDWSKVDPKFYPLIQAFADAEAVVDDDNSQLTQMQRNYVATANTYFIEDLLRELTLNPEFIEAGNHPLFIRQEKDIRQATITTGPNYRIAQVKMDGKWMEFWFGDVAEGKWQQCCKQYMLWELAEKAELEEYVLNHGFVGLMVTWPTSSDRPTAIFKENEADD